MGTDYYFSMSFPVRKMYLFPKLSPSGCVLKVGFYDLGVQVVLSHPEVLMCCSLLYLSTTGLSLKMWLLL